MCLYLSVLGSIRYRSFRRPPMLPSPVYYDSIESLSPGIWQDRNSSSRISFFGHNLHPIYTWLKSSRVIPSDDDEGAKFDDLQSPSNRETFIPFQFLKGTLTAHDSVSTQRNQLKDRNTTSTPSNHSCKQQFTENHITISHHLPSIFHYPFKKLAASPNSVLLHHRHETDNGNSCI